MSEPINCEICGIYHYNTCPAERSEAVNSQEYAITRFKGRRVVHDVLGAGSHDQALKDAEAWCKQDPQNHWCEIDTPRGRRIQVEIYQELRQSDL